MAGVVCLVMLAYGRSLAGGWVYEDTILPVTGWADALHPLNRLLDRVIALAVRPWGPMADRLVSLALHLLNGALCWRLARAVISERAAVFAAGLLLLNPLSTEAVAYVAARPELLALTFTLLALLQVERSRLVWAWICCALALFGKETGLLAFALIPLWAWWRGYIWSVRARGFWLATWWLVTMAFVAEAGARGWLPQTWAFLPAHLTQASYLLSLSVIGLWDVSRFSIDHDWIWITRPIAFAVLAGWSAALLLAWRRHWPLWGFALLWVLVALAPRLLFGFADDLHERHTYTALIGLSMAAGAFLFPVEMS